MARVSLDLTMFTDEQLINVYRALSEQLNRLKQREVGSALTPDGQQSKQQAQDSVRHLLFALWERGLIQEKRSPLAVGVARALYAEH
jgi:hypothetical protein